MVDVDITHIVDLPGYAIDRLCYNNKDESPSNVDDRNNENVFK